MIQIEPIQNLDGFGSGQTPGEYYYSQGMCKTQFGLTPNWVISEQINSGSLAGLNVINWFSANNSNVYGQDSAGLLYGTALGSINWTKQYTPFILGHGNGMIVDQMNRVIVAGDRYLNKWDGSTPSYSTGTITVTNGSPNVTGSGTTFTSAMAGKQIFIQTNGGLYTVLSVTDATHLVLTINYGGPTNSGFTFTIYTGSVEQWKDFGASYQITGLRPMDLFQDWVVIGNSNAVALLNVTDDSFTNVGLNLPSGYNVAALKSGITGILVGVNVNNKGAIFLWDAQANGSISNWIWFNGNIKAILPTNEGGYYGGWFVFTSRGIYSTNGYTIQPIYEQMPDDRINYSHMLSGLQPNQVERIGNYLLFLGGGSFNRMRAGLYILNLQTRTFEFCPSATNVQYNVNFGGLFYDNSFTLNLSYHTIHPASSVIAQLQNSPPSSAYFITEPKAVQLTPTSSPSNEKNAEAAKFTIVESARHYGTVNNTYNISLKVYNFRRALWSYAQTVSGTSDTTHFSIDGTSQGGRQIASIGDEVTILEGLNAGQIAHITGIANQGTTVETWTLDTTLPNVTETGIYVVASPFLLVHKFTFSNLSQLRDVYFDIASRYKGKRFLLKLLFTNINNTELDITDGQFIYDDQGVMTS